MCDSAPKTGIGPGYNLSCSIVIPTVGRSSLERSVRSALAQREVEVEVVVVMNGKGSLPLLPTDDRLKVVKLVPGVGGNAARNRGIAEAKYEAIALLDDDDWWHPDKLRLQLGHAHALSLSMQDNWMISCRLESVDLRGNTHIWPAAHEERIEDVQEFLFRRRSFRSHRPQLQSSTLVFPRSLGQRFPFNESTSLHQDWEWLLSLASSLDAPCQMVDQVLTHCAKDDGGSVTRSTRWSDSLSWGRSNVAAELVGDFALGVPFRFAINQRSCRGVLQCYRTALSTPKTSKYAYIYSVFAMLRALISGIRTAVIR